MNSIQSAEPTHLQYSTDTSLRTTSKLPQFLRFSGALAIIASGLIYMLQGLDNADLALRNWVYLALMMALGAGGIFSYRYMEDSKGARLFFALGTLIIPVQFSQLGGMVFHLFSGNTGISIEAFQLLAPSLPMLLAMVALSTALSLALSFAGLSILARPHAKKLTGLYLLLNIAMLIPFRDSYLGLMLLSGFFIGSCFTQAKLFAAHTLFKSFEGLGVRLMFLLPTAIVTVRSAFHISELLGLGALLLCVALLCLFLANYDGLKQHLKDFILIFSYGFACFGLLTCSWEVSQVTWIKGIDSVATTFVYTLPLLACTLYFAFISPRLSAMYRLFATALLCCNGLAILIDPGSLGLFILVLLGAAFAYFGYERKKQLPLLAGTIVSLTASGYLLQDILNNVDVNLWLCLAIAGLVMVAGSSVLEKHGKRYINQSKKLAGDFRQWGF